MVMIRESKSKRTSPQLTREADEEGVIKTNSEMKHPGIQLVSPQRNPLVSCLETGVTQGMSLLMFPALLTNLLHSLDLP